jgi:hypothetical protein
VKLLLSDKGIIGGAYPLKMYDWSKLLIDPNDSNKIQTWINKKNNSFLKTQVSDIETIRSNCMRFNINFLENTIEIKNNLTKVRHLATGFMMIKREVLEKMIEAYPSTKYVDDVSFLKQEENKFAYALFDCGVEDGHYYSEDWLFCSRYLKMGGSVWLDISINLTHTGVETFSGSFMSTLV